jgi:hypothetical protein
MITHLNDSAEFGHCHCLFHTVFGDRIVGCVLHVCVLPIESSIEYRSDNGINTGVFLALNFEEGSEQTTLVFENLLVIMEYISQEVVDASFTWIRQRELRCPEWPDEKLRMQMVSDIQIYRISQLITVCIISRSRTYSISLLINSKVTLKEGRHYHSRHHHVKYNPKDQKVERTIASLPPGSTVFPSRREQQGGTIPARLLAL